MSKGKIGSGLVAALGAAGLASTAAAQPSMPTTGPTGGAERRVDVSLRASATYDSAVPQRGVVNAQPSIRDEDVLYSPSASLDVVMPLGRLYTYAQGDVGYEFYHKDPELNSDRLNVTAGVGGEIGICGASLSGAWNHGRTSSQDVTLGFIDNVQETTTGSLQVQCAPGAGFTASAGAAYGETDNSAPRGAVNSEVASYNASLGYQNARLGSISLIAQHQTADYSPANFSLGLVQSADTEISNFGIQYERPIGRRLLGRVNVGYGVVETQGLPDNDGLTADVALTYRPSNRLDALLTYRRYASSTIVAGIDYLLNEQFALGMSYRLSQRISMRAGGNYLERRYVGKIPPNTIGAPSDEEVLGAYAGLSMRIGRKSTISLDAQYQDRRADVPALNFDSVRIGLVVATSF